MPFTGFTPDTLAFLADLAEHNDRAWFAENRSRYERELLGRQREFVDALGEAFAEIDPRVQAVPSVDRSIFRINRDTRFSPDKSPYKPYADVWLWIGADRKVCPGYFLRITPEALLAGGGAHRLDDAGLARMRAGVLSPDAGARLEAILGRLGASGLELSEPSRSRVPRGFDASHPRAELLKHDQLHAITRAEPVPPEFFGPELVEWSMARFLAAKPLVDWLAEELVG